MVSSLSRVLEPGLGASWRRLQDASPGAGATDLLYRVEQYAAVLARNMLQLFTQPFDAVSDNIGQSRTLLTALCDVRPRSLNPPPPPSIHTGRVMWRVTEYAPCAAWNSLVEGKAE